MKKIILICLILVGCWEATEDVSIDNCSLYFDLCGPDSNISYYICTNDSGSLWYEVDDKKYYNIDYMFDQECGF